MTISKVNNGIHKGQYKVRIQPRDQVTHKRISIPIEYAQTKKEAMRIENRMWLKIQNGYDFSIANEYCSNCFKKYVTEQFKQGRWGKKTYQAWQYSCRVVNEYLSNVRMKDVNQTEIRKFIRKFASDRKVIVNSSSVVAKVLNHLRAFFKKYEGTIYAKNPIPLRALEVFFRDDEISLSIERYILSQDEINSLIDEIRQQIDKYGLGKSSSRLAIWVDIETGMRPQEIQALRWDNLRKDSGAYVFEISDAWSDVNKALNGHLKARKRREKRKTLPISGDLYLYLKKFEEVQKKYLEKEQIANTNDFIFLNMSDYQKCQLGYPITQTSLNEMLKKLGRKIEINPNGKKWSMYSLRHTVATKLASMNGMNYSWAADRLGHTLNEFMRTYVHVDKDLNSRMMKLWIKH
ncbi:tyrosine-type recombinase/integrase [Ligilactobacillus araffinosus]|uniref:Integrase n=1 Tax=Ligilactobacillus araffinosus DSM 20653 TaxID=1423820 RepID=A0A0R1ZCR0_9LACO|nr:tyrosine-type recombinase/integrase [Ligilactobacillus araffinosus]KRM52130.1 integrase [Ligilactobacillus araffinosus DSM 20653]